MKLWEENKLTAHSLYSALQDNLPCGWQQYPRGQPSVREPPYLRRPLVLGRCHRCLQDAWLPWGSCFRRCLLLTWPALLNVSYHPRKSILFALPCCVLTTISQTQAIRATAQSTFGEMHNVNYTMDRVTSKLFIKIFFMTLKFNYHSIHSCQATLDFFLQVRCYGNETNLSDCYHMSRCIKV